MPIIYGYNIFDVHVEMMEGCNVDSPITGHRSVGKLPRRLPGFSYDRVPYIGQSLGQQDSSTDSSSGTLGRYKTVHSRDPPPKRCALTCSHVVSLAAGKASLGMYTIL